MKKFFLLLLLLNSCSLNSDSSFWNESINSNYEELTFDKDYTFKEYGEILDKYNDNTKIPKIN